MEGREVIIGWGFRIINWEGRIRVRGVSCFGWVLKGGGEGLVFVFFSERAGPCAGFRMGD